MVCVFMNACQIPSCLTASGGYVCATEPVEYDIPLSAYATPPCEPGIADIYVPGIFSV
jgi:hypothetical protein